MTTRRGFLGAIAAAIVRLIYSEIMDSENADTPSPAIERIFIALAACSRPLSEYVRAPSSERPESLPREYPSRERPTRP